MASIGDLFFLFRGDDSQLQLDASKAGTTAGTSFNATFGASLKRAAVGAIGAGIGAGIGMILTGANQLDAATRRLQADTGMTAAEAAKAEKALAGMYRNNIQGFDAIGAVMARVHNDLGLTGTAADALTAKFLKFGTATGQDAADAALSFDHALDALNLKATDAPALMDKLIVSHQRFGGVISESVMSLAAMAPALNAANMSVDDGIALLNLFEAAGVDASKAPLALAKALNKVKSPEELKKLIADITATTDPFERAKKAIDLFGSRAGPQLAQALAQGNLDQYVIDATAAAGATDKAAAAVESGFGEQFKLIMKQAGGALAEFGTQFGPLLMVASAFGPQMIKAIGAGFGGIAGLLAPKLVAMMAPAIASAGLTSGTALGTAIALAVPLGLAALAAIPVVLVFSAVTGDIATQDAALTTKTTSFAQSAAIAALRQARAGIAQELAKTKEGFHPIEDLLGLSGTSQIQAKLDILDAEIAHRTAELGKTAATGIASGQSLITAAAATAFGGIPYAVAAQIGPTRQTISDLLHAAAQQIAGGRKTIDSEIDALNALAKKPDITATKELERLLKTRTSPLLLSLLKSPDAEKQAAAKALAADLDLAIAGLKPRPGIMSSVSKKLISDLKTSTSTELQAFAGWFGGEFTRLTAIAAALTKIPTAEPGRGGIASNATPAQIAARQAALAAASLDPASINAIHSLVKAALLSADPLIRNDAKKEGVAFAASMAEGIADRESKAAAQAAANKLVGSVVDWLRSDSVHRQIADAWRSLTSSLTFDVPTFLGAPSGVTIDPVTGQKRAIRDSGGPVNAGTPYIVGANRQPELFVPAQSGQVLTMGQVGDALGRGATSNQSIYIDHVTVADANDEMSVIARLRFLSLAGG